MDPTPSRRIARLLTRRLAERLHYAGSMRLFDRLLEPLAALVMIAIVWIGTLI